MLRARATQVGLLMRSYRESFSTEGGRRGLTQEALLERMGSGDSDYAERYSHATVSRWESGGTRPTLQRLKVLGKALSLSRSEVAGLILLAGLALDFPTALAGCGKTLLSTQGRKLFDDKRRSIACSERIMRIGLSHAECRRDS